MSPARRLLVRATSRFRQDPRLGLRIQRRIADDEVSADQVLAMTFTRKAGATNFANDSFGPGYVTCVPAPFTRWHSHRDPSIARITTSRRSRWNRTDDDWSRPRGAVARQRRLETRRVATPTRRTGDRLGALPRLHRRAVRQERTPTERDAPLPASQFRRSARPLRRTLSLREACSTSTSCSRRR